MLYLSSFVESITSPIRKSGWTPPASWQHFRNVTKLGEQFKDKKAVHKKSISHFYRSKGKEIFLKSLFNHLGFPCTDLKSQWATAGFTSLTFFPQRNPVARPYPYSIVTGYGHHKRYNWWGQWPHVKYLFRLFLWLERRSLPQHSICFCCPSHQYCLPILGHHSIRHSGWTRDAI